MLDGKLNLRTGTSWKVFFLFFCFLFGLPGPCDFPWIPGNISEKAFVSQERVSGFRGKGADLQGSPRNFRGTSGEVWETSGESLDCC